MVMISWAPFRRRKGIDEKNKKDRNGTMRLYLMMFTLLISSLTVFAFTTSQESSSAEFTKFWSKFRAAVIKNDKEAVASLTKLPFVVSNKSLDKSEFIKSYPKLFDRKIRRCFMNEKPSRDNESYSLFCGANGDQGLLFEKVNGEYRFVAFYFAD
jgi:hypothetical protein